MEKRAAFAARVLDTDPLRQALDARSPTGDVSFVVAVFGVPDTGVPFGKTERETIDHGAFRAWSAARERPTYPIFADHGDMPKNGYFSLEKKLGFTTRHAEQTEGLLIDANYNLEAPLARTAYSHLLHDPEGAQFSFSWDPSREVAVRSEDTGMNHVKELWPVEFSQVGLGAQREAHLVSARAAVPSHSTPTSDDTWERNVNRRRLTNNAAALRKAHAWVDPDGDPEEKESYKFLHHYIGEDGSVGAAAQRACSNAVAVLNGGRREPDIPDSDRAGVYRHVAKHLADMDRVVPPLRMEPWSADELAELLHTTGFKEVVAEVLVAEPDLARSVRDAALIALDEKIAEAAARSEGPSPITNFYRELFDSAASR